MKEIIDRGDSVRLITNPTLLATLAMQSWEFSPMILVFYTIRVPYNTSFKPEMDMTGNGDAWK